MTITTRDLFLHTSFINFVGIYILSFVPACVPTTYVDLLDNLPTSIYPYSVVYALEMVLYCAYSFMVLSIMAYPRNPRFYTSYVDDQNTKNFDEQVILVIVINSFTALGHLYFMSNYPTVSLISQAVLLIAFSGWDLMNQQRRMIKGQVIRWSQWTITLLYAWTLIKMAWLFSYVLEYSPWIRVIIGDDIEIRQNISQILLVAVLWILLHRAVTTKQRILNVLILWIIFNMAFIHDFILNYVHMFVPPTFFQPAHELLNETSV